MLRLLLDLVRGALAIGVTLLAWSLTPAPVRDSGGFTWWLATAALCGLLFYTSEWLFVRSIWSEWKKNRRAR